MEQPVRLAGKALIWQSIQMGGVKVIFLIRIFVLARLLNPVDFGLVAIATTAMGFLLSITNLGMIPALVQGKEMDDAQYDAAWTVGITRSALIAALLVIAAPLIANLFDEPRAVTIIRIIALNPLLEALASIKLAALNRNLTFRPLAFLRLANALVNTVVSVIFASLYGVWGLVAGLLAGSATSVFISYLLAPHHPRLLLNQEAIRPLMNFGRWIFITSLITMAGSYILRIVISRGLGTEALGLYYLASQLAFIPGEIASEVVGNVAFPLYARLQTDINQATRVFRASFTSLAALLYPICALIIVLAPTITQNILGNQWKGTGPVVQVLTFVAMIGIFGEATVPILKGFGQPYKITQLELIQSTTIITLVWLLTRQYGLVGAAMAWLPAITISQFLNAYFISRIFKKPFEGLKWLMLAILTATSISALIASTIIRFIPGMMGLILSAGVAVTIASLLLLILDRLFSLGFVRNLIWVFPQVAIFTRIPSRDIYKG